jgi:hypothetical protein
VHIGGEVLTIGLSLLLTVCFNLCLSGFVHAQSRRLDTVDNSDQSAICAVHGSRTEWHCEIDDIGKGLDSLYRTGARNPGHLGPRSGEERSDVDPNIAALGNIVDSNGWDDRENAETYIALRK